MSSRTETDPQYAKGYESLAQFVGDMTLSEAEHCFALRLASLDGRSAFNRGGTDAVRDHIERLRHTR